MFACDKTSSSNFCIWGSLNLSILIPCKSEGFASNAFVRAGIPVGDRKSVPTKFSSIGSYCTLTRAKTCQEKIITAHGIAISYPDIQLCDLRQLQTWQHLAMSNMFQKHACILPKRTTSPRSISTVTFSMLS